MTEGNVTVSASRFAFACVLVAATCLAGGCKGRAPKPLTVHVGGTMTPVMERLGELYASRTGRKVEVNSAGSGELLANIKLNKEGDVYVCHDPFMDILMQKHRMGVDGWTLAELTPVIVVQKGNPKNIRGLKDLLREDLTVWFTDYQRSTLGRMLPTIFSKVGVDFRKAAAERKFPTHRKGGNVASRVKMKTADAAMCWNAVAALRADGVDIVTIPPEHLPVPHVDTVTSATGKEYPLTPVRVTVCTLTCSDQPAEAGAFAEFVASPEAAETLKEYGFTLSGTKKNYENGAEIN
jgi:molybdate transport system substrate-binding protein